MENHVMMPHMTCSKGSSLALMLALAVVLISCRPPRHHPEEGYRGRQGAEHYADDDGGSPLPETAAKLVVKSPAFEPGGEYPAEFTCDGETHRRLWSGAAHPLERKAMP